MIRLPPRALGAALLALLAVLAAGAASAPRAAETERLVVVTAGGEKHRFEVELALTPAQQAKGLMHRERLAADAGMLFDFREEREITMWMKNTPLPLDMIFIRDDGRISRIAERTMPYSLATVSSRRPARAVLEVNGGTAARLGIRPGDRVVHRLFDADR